MPTTPLIVDVDTGIDDSLALLYLLASPEAELVGITCTAGNVNARQVAINNLAWLELCDGPDVEVALGADGQPWRATGAELAENTYEQPIFPEFQGRFITAD